MDWTLWAGFVAASLLVGLIPGPGVTTIVGYALTAGRRTALASVFGATLGNGFAMALSLAGAGVILAQSAFAFSILKWIGAAYLIGIGLYGVLAASHAGAAANAPAIAPKAAFWGTVVITSLNPKTIIFFVAFAPQFISAQFDYWSQAAVLLVTFCAVVTFSDGLYALAAGSAAQYLKGPKVRLWSQRAGGGVLVAAGVATAAANRN